MITEGKTKSNIKQFIPKALRPEVPPPAPKPLNKAIESTELKLLKQFIEDLKKLQTYNTGFEGGGISFKTEVDINKLIKQYEFVLRG